MPHTVNIPFDSYTLRQNERRHQVENRQALQRPRTEGVYSTPNSISYFNNNQKVSHYSYRESYNPYSISRYNSPYSTNLTIHDNYSNLYYEDVPGSMNRPPRLPPLPPRPAKLVVPNNYSASITKSIVHRLATISDVDFVHRRRLSKQSSNESASEFSNKTRVIRERLVRPSGKRPFFIGLTSLVLGLVMFTFYDSMIFSLMNSSMQLKEGGALTESWQNIPMPMDACFYLFEVKNGQKFIQGAKPRVVEHGPFCYFEYKKRTVLEWKEHTVIYTERFDFVFNERVSKSLDTQLQIVNLPVLLTVMMTKHILKTFYLSFASPIVLNSLSVILRITGEQMVETRTAREILEGRKIKMVEYTEMMLKPLKAIGLPIPAMGVGAYKMHNASFGIVSQRMHTDFGPYEVFTKTEQGHTFGEILTLEERDTFPTYRYPCNQMKGGDGMFFGPNFEANLLTIFNQHACRSLTMVKNGTITKNGMTLSRYVLDPHIFDMSLRRNRCYCLENRPWQDCDGWTDMSPCMGGIPMGLSFPHFLNTPRRLREVDGLQPDPVKHFGYMDLEPQMGIPVGAKISIQGTIAVSAISTVPSMSLLPKVVLPLFWCQEGATVKGAMAIGMSIGSNSIRYGSLACLFAGSSIAMLFFNRAYQARKQNRPITVHQIG